MGFFSYECNGCGHPLLSNHVTNKVNEWMEEGTVIFTDGTIAHGIYDGYGRLEGVETNIFGGTYDYDNVCVWHSACWEHAGSPTERKQSKSADDQGFFYNDPKHNMVKPEVTE